ncbi:DUF4041 domain-containing protein [Fusobacterium necrophorum]|uniref:DUF4041 domain-containing protein n=1 Tax=Fusobacterium necrophorum TaxID=859 RepID=UPI00370E3967
MVFYIVIVILLVIAVVGWTSGSGFQRENLILKQEKDILEKENQNLKNKYNDFYSKVEKEYKQIMDMDQAVQEKENEKNEIEKEILKLKSENETEKERALKILDKKRELEKEIEILEEKQDLQEFSFYQPKYYYESSAHYKAMIERVNNEMKWMIKDKKAATCSVNWEVGGDKKKGKKMIDDNLKLMLRAFNGEADAAIAKVKFNNVHVMEKRINKAYETINKLNETNMCIISGDYLRLKLQELYMNYEMAQKEQEEKEEQRAIREQIKEEERAQREFEKAQLEAQKEEERAQKALEQAQQKLQEAHGAALDKLNAKIELLKAQLEEASHNKERAMSMAQQTKSGHVYVISNIGSFGENVYKIGMTRRLDPMDRVRELGDASVPFNFDVHAMIYSKNAPELENALHKKFYDNRVNKINDRREFFRVNLDEVEKVVKEYNAEIEFTKIAKAEQYRETLAMEQNQKTKSEIQEEEQEKERKEEELILNI